MQWRREEERASTDALVSEIATNVKLKDGKSGRVISINADAGGKIGSKVCSETDRDEHPTDRTRTIVPLS
jgi:N-acetyltransferase